MNKILSILSVFMPIVVVFMSLFQLVQISGISHQGQEIDQIEQKLSQIREENEILANQAALAESYLYLKQKADELGFIVPTKTETINVAWDVALR